jgi:hypothetical protein
MLSFHLIVEPIEALFEEPPEHAKSPHCPQAFQWRGRTWKIDTVLLEWRDYRRRGKMSRNMRPAHTEQALETGSYGVGRFYFRVKSEGREFEIYYDREVKNASDRKGHWFLLGEHCQTI